MEVHEGPIRQMIATYLKAVMSDAELYGWDRARAFHSIWLNQLEQRHCTWMDDEEKLRFRCSPGWHPVSFIPLSPYYHQDISKDQSAQAHVSSQVQRPSQAWHQGLQVLQ